MTQERRKHTRMGISLPVDVKGFEIDGRPWGEMTSSQEISFGGVSFLLKHLTAPGQVLHLSLPLPKTFRRYDVATTSYQVFSLVRWINADKAPIRIGALFLGRNPPKEFEENRGGRFLLPDDNQPGGPTRRFARHDLMLGARLHRLQPAEGTPGQELTVTDDIGRGGAKVRTALPIVKGEVVDLEAVDRTFTIRAVVQNISTGTDHVLRLHLAFVEAMANERIGEILRAAGIHD
jgi:hypothetical protein